MKNKIILSLIAISFMTITYSCQADLDDTLQNISSVETNAATVKKYVNENTYIDLDVYQLVKDVASPKTRASVNIDQIAQMKAAIYRFYSHVQVVNGFYKCSLKAASDINVSEGVYIALLNNLNDMNKNIQKAIDKGISFNVQEADEEYLNSLLK